MFIAFSYAIITANLVYLAAPIIGEPESSMTVITLCPVSYRDTVFVPLDFFLGFWLFFCNYNQAVFLRALDRSSD